MEWKGQLMLNFIVLYPKLYSFHYEQEAHFDIDENGIEAEVEKQLLLTRKENCHCQ